MRTSCWYRALAIVLLALMVPAVARAAVPGKPEDAVRHAKISSWKPIFKGVEYCEGRAKKPRPLEMRAFRVDLREPTVSFLVTPPNGEAPKDTDARKTSEFLTEFKCQVAINGSPFGPFASKKGDPQDVVGISMSRGDLYSPAHKDYDAILIGKDKRVTLARKSINASKAEHAIGGFYALLIDGRNNGGMKALHPRSALGVTRDGRYLILMVIDGRQEGYSEGTTTAETAEWIRKLGAYNALNLDGGGSTTLVMDDGEGKPKVLNRPSGKFQRHVANHLGVYAKPLPPAKNTPAEAPPSAVEKEAAETPQ